MSFTSNAYLCCLRLRPAGQWPPNEAQDGSDSGSDSDARRASGSHSDAAACLTSDGGTSPRGATPSGASAMTAAGTAGASGGAPGDSGGSGARQRQCRRPASRRRSSNAAGGLYFPVVHCGSVRQAARVVAMREVALVDDPVLGGFLLVCLSPHKHTIAHEDDESGMFHVPQGAVPIVKIVRWCQGRAIFEVSSMCLIHDHVFAGSSLASAVAAAAALLGDDGHGDGALTSPHAGGSVGCATAVTLLFVKRPEWLQRGARLILRDRGDGCAAGAGIVRELHWGVMPAAAAADGGDGNKSRPSFC